MNGFSGGARTERPSSSSSSGILTGTTSARRTPSTASVLGRRRTPLESDVACPRSHGVAPGHDDHFSMAPETADDEGSASTTKPTSNGSSLIVHRVSTTLTQEKDDVHVAACTDRTADNECETNRNEEATCRGKTLLLRRWNDMPNHLQFNPHIRTGYRPLMTIWGCMRSLFYVHNETVNIVTHGFPIVYILVTVPSLLPWSRQGPLALFLSWCHLIGAVSPWIGSFAYHLFMNLDRGESFYKKLLQLDMLGIWIVQSIGALPMIAASVHCLQEPFWHCCMITYCILSLWGLLMAMKAWSPWERRLCFAPPFMMRMLMLILRFFGIAGGSRTVMTHLVLQDLLAVIGGTVGALHVPEKWFPGRVDFILNSHNIMHVLVVMAVYSMHVATIKDLAWMSNSGGCVVPLPISLASVHEEL